MKKTFTTKDANGKEIELCLVSLTAKQNVEAQLVYNKAWRDAEEKGCIILRNLDDIATRQGLWDENKKARVEEIELEMRHAEKKLRGGANSLANKEEGRELAIKLADWRDERVELLRAKNDLYQYTAENHADSVRTRYIISVTTKYPSGEFYFKGLDDFTSRETEDAARDAFLEYLKVGYESMPEKEEDKFFENVFLKKNGFMDEEGRLVRQDGKVVNREGRLIDNEGYYLMEDGRRCDVEGTPLTADNEYDIEYKPFD